VLHLSFQPLREMISHLARYPSGSIQDDAVEGRIRAEQIANIKRYLPTTLLANFCNASVLVIALWSSSQRQPAMVWAGTILTFCLYAGFRHWKSVHTSPVYVSRRVIFRAIRNALLLGSLWGAMPLIFFSKASAGGQVIIACLCAGMLGGGAFVLACIPAAAVAFTAPIVLASAITIGSSGDVAYFLVAVLMVSYVSVLWRGVYVHALQLVRRISAQASAERKVRRDELTNLSNRLALFEALETAFARLARLGEAFALLYLDLDDFKSVNDRYGHVAGDKLLVQVAQRLKDCARETDVVARLSGDEFAIVVTGATNATAVTALGNRIVGSLDSSFLVDGVTISTGACIGIALAPADGATSELLLKSADEALYDAKRRSGNVVRLHARDMDTRAA
jgi:diguanylate cyclase